ncbi:MAG TPA: dTMP kinase [Burkholderiaceae bacterium]|nr:dTMP kinase [Burkholderiaceae bacterium]
MQVAGRFFVFDGSNGAGKSTVLEAIASQLREQNYTVITTREPGGTAIGEEIRQLLLNPQSSAMCAQTELLLFAAARAQHVREKIAPALQAGHIVLSDRFDAATVSFQHYARGLSLNLVNTVNEVALDGFAPHLTLVFDIDPVVGLQRVGARATQDRLEAENIAFLERARQGYLKQAQANPKCFTVIDASQPLVQVIAQAAAAIAPHLPLSS